MMKKYQTTSKSTLCIFFNFVGHEDEDCRTLEMMKERTLDSYRVHDEPMTGQPAQQFTKSPQYNNVQQYNQIPQYNTPRANNQGNR